MHGTKIDKKLDIKGVVCPYTLVKSKLAVEDIEVGQVLEILLDYPEASSSIPKAMLNYGHSVLKVEKINDTDWIVQVRKEVED
ncbi:MAG TPA: sulfurtransferase TusA family protein [Nitrospirae bacterium]|nr:sulfurtransferase TusA family protein [Nitrospirota bacterium]